MQGRRVDVAMAQFGGKSGRGSSGSGTRATDAVRTVPHALPADLDRALRHLDDAQLNRLRDAVAAESRHRRRPVGKTSGRGTGRRPAPVTPGQERLVLAAFESGLKPAAIAREFPLSRAKVEAVVTVKKPVRR